MSNLSWGFLDPESWPDSINSCSSRQFRKFSNDCVANVMFWPLSLNLPAVVNSFSIWLARLFTLVPLFFASSLRASSYLLSILKVLVTGG